VARGPTRERVLGLGVEVDLHDAVADRGAHLLGRRAARAVEDVLEARAGMRLRQRGPAVAEDLRAQPDVARRVQAVDVAEGRRQQVAAALAGPERVGDLQELLGRGVEAIAVIALAADAVLLAADDPDLDLEHDVEGPALLEELRRDPQVLAERQRRAVEDVRVERRRLAALAALASDGEQRAQELVDVARRAVVGVEGDGDRTSVGQLVAECCQRAGAGERVARRPGEVARSADRGLDDAVRARLGEAAHRGVEGLRRGDVDRGERVTAGRRAVQHRGVLLG